MIKTAEAYQEYLKSNHWKNLRRVVLNRDGRQCVRCPSRSRLQAHHKFYRERWEDSEPDDLITLCHSCHEREHNLTPTTPAPHPNVVASIGSRRWNSLGQRVDRKGRPFFQKQSRNQKKNRNKWLKKRAGWSF